MLDSNLSFGLQKKSSLIFGTGKIGSIYPINAYEKIITTNKEFVKIEDTTIKKSFNCQFSTSLFIEEANLIVAVSAQKSELYVFTLNDVNNPIIANFPTNQLGVFHLIYSKRSSVLLTIGFGVKIWNFNITIPDRRRSTLKPIVNISLKYSFSGDDSNPIISPEVSNYEASILIPPSFDYSDEIIFLPSSKGIFGYDMNGKQKVIMYRLPSSNKTSYCYLEKKKEMLVYDNTNGLVLCTTSGFVQSRPLVGTTTLIWMDFLDTENALLMDAKGSFYILDLKTGRSFHCYSVLNSTSSSTQSHQKTVDPTLSMMAVLGQSSSMSGLCEINGGYGGLSTAKKMPSRVFLLRESKEVCMCFGPRLETFKIDIPWTLWAINISKTKSLRRIEKPGDAARVVAFTSNSFVKIFSPKDGKILTDATPISLSSPSNFFYDRGFLIYYQGKDDRDGFMVKKVHETQTEERLFVILDDGSISVFDPNQNPCKEIGMANIKANSITLCYFNNEFCYAISSLRSGEIYLVDKFNFNQIKKKFFISHDTFNTLIFDPISVCLVCVMQRETVLFDLRSQKVVSSLKLKGSPLVCLNNAVLYYGYENGDINFVSIKNKELSLLSKEPNRLHFDSVTGFAFSQSFWVSVSADQTVRYWDYSNANFFTINMPCRLFSCEIINGKRDVVVGTDNELMIIDGKTVFDGQIDEIDQVVDNFDFQQDDFQKVIIENVLKLNREEEQRREIEEKLRNQRKNLNRDDRNRQRNRKFNANKIADIVSTDQITPQKVEQKEITEEMKAQMKEEEEKRRNKAFEAMMDITDHDRKFRQIALAKENEKEKMKDKKDDQNQQKSWTIKMNSNSKHENPDSLSTSKPTEPDEPSQIVTVTSNVQITAPSVLMKAENTENQAETGHNPRRKRKKRVIRSKEEDVSQKVGDEITAKPTEIQEKIPIQNDQNNTQLFEKVESSQKVITIEKVTPNEQTVTGVSQKQDEAFKFTNVTEKRPEIIENSESKENEYKFNDYLANQNPEMPSLSDASTETEKTSESHMIEEVKLNTIQPPSIEAKSIRTKKLSKSAPKRANIATSPISTINIDTDTDSSHPSPRDDSSNTFTLTETHRGTQTIKINRKTKKKFSESSIKKFPKLTLKMRRYPTPPQVVRRPPLFLRPLAATRRRRPHSSSHFNRRQTTKLFEIPAPQFVLDIDAVRSEFGRGKVELLPIVQRIEHSLTSTQFLNDELNNSIGSNNSTEKVKPLIEKVNSKKIVMPMTASKRNKSFGGGGARKTLKKQLPSRRPLGHYENSVTYINSANPTPRQLIPKSKKNSSSVENKKNQKCDKEKE